LCEKYFILNNKIQWPIIYRAPFDTTAGVSNNEYSCAHGAQSMMSSLAASSLAWTQPKRIDRIEGT
jgi:hypothetical protein